MQKILSLEYMNLKYFACVLNIANNLQYHMRLLNIWYPYNISHFLNKSSKMTSYTSYGKSYFLWHFIEMNGTNINFSVSMHTQMELKIHVGVMFSISLQNSLRHQYHANISVTQKFSLNADYSVFIRRIYILLLP